MKMNENNNDEYVNKGKLKLLQLGDDDNLKLLQLDTYLRVETV